MQATTISKPKDFPTAILMASFKPVFFSASLVLFLYDLLSENFKGS